jgi:hypothetical protein
MRAILLRFMLWVVELMAPMKEDHIFEPVVSLCEDDGRLLAYRCIRCGYRTFMSDASLDYHPPCVPREHEWVPVEVFQWENLALHGKLAKPLQCAACGAHALTESEFRQFGCPGSRYQGTGDEVRDQTTRATTA